MHSALEIPPPRSVFDIILEDGAITRVRQHGDPDCSVRLFLSHGNGFAIDGYLPFWQPLLISFEVVLFDYRNHGWNAPSDPARHHYTQLARDTESLYHGVTARLGAKPSVGVFHSMAAKAAMKHAVEIGWRWHALVLFDPPNVPPPEHPLHSEMSAHGQRLAAWVQHRRECFAEPSQLAEVFKRLRVHQKWVPGAHDLMARALLRQDATTGAWRLVCPGALEAQMYRSNMALNLWPPASAFGGPVLLICADPTVPRPGSPALVNKLLADTQGYRYEVIPGTGHMLQLEQPEACRQVMVRFLAGYGLADHVGVPL